MERNGFQFRINQAKQVYAERTGILLQNVTKVLLVDLQAAFKPHKSWKDLNNVHSDFVSFLKDSWQSHCRVCCQSSVFTTSIARCKLFAAGSTS